MTNDAGRMVSESVLSLAIGVSRTFSHDTTMAGTTSMQQAVRPDAARAGGRR